MKYSVFYYRMLDRDNADYYCTRLLSATHRMVAVVEASDLDDVFTKMQGFNWSPNGEARELISSLGLRHTSMSVGDVVKDAHGVYWLCAEAGWELLPELPENYASLLKLIDISHTAQVQKVLLEVAELAQQTIFAEKQEPRQPVTISVWLDRAHNRVAHITSHETFIDAVQSVGWFEVMGSKSKFQFFIDKFDRTGFVDTPVGRFRTIFVNGMWWFGGWSHSTLEGAFVKWWVTQ